VAEGELIYGGEVAGPTVAPEVQTCQAEKPVLLQVGDVADWWVNDIPWVSTSVPVQIFVIGQVAIVASSFETTTMAGRRLRKLLGSTLAPMGVREVVIAGIANSYTAYLTTREEYALQHFEGAFTHFGPWSEAAFRQENDRLARSLVTGEPVLDGITPRDLRGDQAVRTQIAQNGVVLDAPPLGSAFGDVVSDVQSGYAVGARVSVSFWSAHPRTYLQLTQEGTIHPYYDPVHFHFLEVQRRVGSDWETIATDRDPHTHLHWQRIGGPLSPESQVSVHWDLRDAAPGTYRIVHRGLAKQSLLGLAPTYQPFSGQSASFSVQ
jgi:neutral ceramidase